ncbi:MAG: DNA polymerase III subunit gamma/tau [Rhodospirillales bacterium]
MLQPEPITELMTEPSAPAPADDVTATESPVPGTAGKADAGAYRVLARKYRPANFTELVGQEALVRTLTNAIHRGRLAHAFLLTGVRGVGKTTTARIIARALNCIGPDGEKDGKKTGPTAEPCGVCEHCRAIGEDRHMDVLEMDAASRTGVDDIRELIEGVRYRPTSARFKVYIIDEVHMLSRNAFNALLKTLEEPPEHVKFIFCTTETGKIPVTVLSRCQRFDLRRVEIETLMGHLGSIAKQEGTPITDEALALLARAADGSVRDGLSLLDQAISLAGREDAGNAIDDAQIRAMLGLADRGVTFDILDAVMRGDVGAALDAMAGLYEAGADPVSVIEDLLELTHWLTRLKVASSALAAPGLSEAERTRGPEMANALAMPVLTRAWQMLLKGLNEVRTAPRPVQAFEMVLIRLAYAAELPSPAEALQAMEKGGNGAGASPGKPVPPAGATNAQAAQPAPSSSSSPSRSSAVSETRPQAVQTSQTVRAVKADPVAQAHADRPEPSRAAPALETFEAVTALAAARREATLLAHLENYLHLVSFEPGRVEFRPAEGAPSNLAGRLGEFLKAETGERWVVSVSRAEGAATVQQQRNAADEAAKAEAAAHPLIQAVMENFPGARIEAVRTRKIEAFDSAPEVDEDDESSS